MSCSLRHTLKGAVSYNPIKVGCRLLHSYDAGGVETDNELNIGKFGSFTVFRLNRPDKRNCLNLSTATKLKEGLIAFNNDQYSSVGIICGEGGNFCSGLDCNELANNKDFYKKFLELDLMGEFSRKPLIAAVNGYAVGTGFDLALWCDMRVVEETAVFGYFNRRLGVPVSDDSVRRLLNLVGKARALDWILTGRIVRPNEAFQAGIVSRLVACGTSYGQTVSLAKTIEKYPFSSTMWERINLHLDSYSVEEQENMLSEKDKILSSLEETYTEHSKRFVDGFGRHGKSTNIK